MDFFSGVVSKVRTTFNINNNNPNGPNPTQQQDQNGGNTLSIKTNTKSHSNKTNNGRSSRGHSRNNSQNVSNAANNLATAINYEPQTSTGSISSNTNVQTSSTTPSVNIPSITVDLIEQPAAAMELSSSSGSIPTTMNKSPLMKSQSSPTGSPITTKRASPFSSPFMKRKKNLSYGNTNAILSSSPLLPSSNSITHPTTNENVKASQSELMDFNKGHRRAKSSSAASNLSFLSSSPRSSNRIAEMVRKKQHRKSADVRSEFRLSGDNSSDSLLNVATMHIDDQSDGKETKHIRNASREISVAFSLDISEQSSENSSIAGNDDTEGDALSEKDKEKSVKTSKKSTKEKEKKKKKKSTSTDETSEKKKKKKSSKKILGEGAEEKKTKRKSKSKIAEIRDAEEHSQENSKEVSKKKKKSSKDKEPKDSSKKKTRKVRHRRQASINEIEQIDPDLVKIVDPEIDLTFGVMTKRGEEWILKSKASVDLLPARSQIDYRSFLEMEISECCKEQIEKDLPRTFPQFQLFREQESMKTLYNVLKAVAIYRPEVEYCQGMSLVAGFLLLFMPEEDAFWVMIQLLDNYGMAELWQPSLSGLHRCFFVLERLIENGLPALNNHFKIHDIYTSMYATPWFMTVSLYNHSLQFSMKFWDLFIEEGFTFLYTVMLATLTVHEKKLLTCDMENLLDFLRFSRQGATCALDGDKVLDVASSLRETVKASVALFEEEYYQSAGIDLGLSQ